VRLLLDTNTCIEILRGKQAVVLARYASCARSDIALSAIVRSELQAGALLSAKPDENRQVVESFCALYSCLPFDALAADVHAQWHVRLRRTGQMIGANDLMIAATALVHGLTVITHNIHEFQRVTDLRIEDWQI
jgi:tRNA(fMet)-specific endonuclease VapC